MLGKIIEEIVKRLLDSISKRPYGITLFLMLAVVGIAFLLLQYLRSTPSALETLRDPFFYVVASATVILGVGIALKQSSQVPGLIVIAVLLILLGIAGGGAWSLYRDTTPTFKIDLAFDETVKLNPALFARFLSNAQQPHIHITFLDRQLIVPNESPHLMFEKVAEQAVGHLRSSNDATHTILVTNKMLGNSKWFNLFYSTRGNFGVVSLLGVADPNNREEHGLALRYLASMVPLVAMHAVANDRKVNLLPDRSPDTDHGCLHDFSTNKLLLIEKLRRGPTLCATETEAMTKAFGPTLVSEYRQILRQSIE